MGMFDWDPRYDIGVEPMNHEHKKLLDLMAQLQRANEAGAAKAVLVNALNQLAAYTITHFRDEEAYMERIQYADRRVHGIIHKQLLEKLEGHRQAFVTGPAPQLTVELFHFLKGGLSSHILGVDMKYGAVTRKKSA